MLKHNIIVLALCFMAYFIGHIDANLTLNCINQFNKLVNCYGHMYQHGFVKEKSEEKFKDGIVKEITEEMFEDEIVKGITEEDPFSIIVHTFYKHSVSSSNPYSNFNEIDLFKKEFINKFDQLPEEELKTKLGALAEKCKNNKEYVDPLSSFSFSYDPKNAEVMYRSVSDYCLISSFF